MWKECGGYAADTFAANIYHPTAMNKHARGSIRARGLSKEYMLEKDEELESV